MYAPAPVRLLEGKNALTQEFDLFLNCLKAAPARLTCRMVPIFWHCRGPKFSLPYAMDKLKWDITASCEFMLGPDAIFSRGFLDPCLLTVPVESSTLRWILFGPLLAMPFPVGPSDRQTSHPPMAV